MRTCFLKLKISSVRATRNVRNARFNIAIDEFGYLMRRKPAPVERFRPISHT